MARLVRPPRISKESAVFGRRAGAGTNEPAVEINGDLRINPLTGGRARGLNALPLRRELIWRADKLPQLNAVTDPSAGNTYSTAEFLALLNADRDWEVLGSGAVSADVTMSAEGGVALASHGGGTNSTYITPHLNTGQSNWTTLTWGTDQESIIEFDIVTGASIANNVVLYAGFKITGTSVVITDDDQAYFRFSSGQSSGQWECIYSVGGTDVVQASGVTVAASTRYHLKVGYDDARYPHFFIGTGTGQTQHVFSGSTAMTDATDLLPFVGVLEASAAVKTMRVLGIAASRNFA